MRVGDELVDFVVEGEDRGSYALYLFFGFLGLQGDDPDPVREGVFCTQGDWTLTKVSIT